MAGSMHLSIDIGSEKVCGALIAVDKKKRAVEKTLCIRCEGRDQIVNAVEEVLAELSVPDISCSIGLAPEFFFFRSLRIPFSDLRQVRSVLQYELQDSVALVEDDYLYEPILYRLTSEETGVLAILLEKAKLKSLLNSFRSYSIDPETVTVSGLPAIVNFLRLRTDSDKDFTVVDIGVRRAAFYLVKDGIVRLVRSIPYKSEGTLGLEGRSHDLARDNRSNHSTILTALAATVENTMAAWQDGGDEYENVPLYITGEASDVNVLSSLKGCLPGAEMAPEGWYHCHDLDTSGREGDQFSDVLYGNCMALGCCVTGGTELLNFRKNGFARSYQSKKVARIARNSLLTAGVLLVAAVVYIAFEYRQVQSKRDRLALEVKKIYSETIPGETRIVDPVHQLGVKVRELKTSTSAAGAAGGVDIDTVDLLKEISERIPPSLQVTFERFIYDRQTARIKGTTDNFNTVDQMKRYLDESSFFREVIIISANVAAKSSGVKFELKLEL